MILVNHVYLIMITIEVYQIRNLMNLAHTGETQFSFENVDVAVIRKHLKNININKATGHDLLPPKLLKLGSHILCYPLCFILNYVLHLWYVSRYS